MDKEKGKKMEEWVKVERATIKEEKEERKRRRRKRRRERKKDANGDRGREDQLERMSE